MSKKLIALALIFGVAGVVFAGGTVGWNQLPTPETGWYWGYDNTEPGPPFENPIIDALPAANEADIHANPNAYMPDRYNDRPFQYQTFPDSFWFYGHWYDYDNYLYIYPDGLISWDDTKPDGANHPPTAIPPFPVQDDPNELIAPLWQDNDPTAVTTPPETNRIYYMHQIGPGINRFIVQWYNVVSFTTNSNTYNYGLILDLGGQDYMRSDECDNTFYFRYGHFCYISATGWTLDNGAAGIEDVSGNHGFTYHMPSDPHIANGRVCRFGYKLVRQHDVIPWAFISPGRMVLRYTDIEPWGVVGNFGKESETFNIVLDIYDDDDTRVYHQVVAGYHLDSDDYDIVNFPCWMPEELYEEGIHYYRKELITSLDGDLCKNNDTLVEMSYVHCDDSLGYEWDFNNIYTGYWSPNYSFGFYVFGTSYRMDGGVLVKGGRIFMADTDPMKSGYYGYILTDPPRLDIWESNNGCGMPRQDGNVGYGVSQTYQDGWNYAGIPGKVGPRKTDPPGGPGQDKIIEDLGIYAVANINEGNIWGAATSSGVGTGSAGTGGWVSCLALLVAPEPTTCYGGSPLHRGAIWQVNHNHGWYSWYPGYYNETMIVELTVHLGFNPESPRPQPPCYYDYPHDLTIYRVNKPDREYVEDGDETTVELALGNIGRQTEPDETFFPVKLFVVDYDSPSKDTVHAETTQMTHIGWFGDDTDGPDTTLVPMLPWTPEGICKDWVVENGGWENNPIPKELVGVHYEMIGLVRLGEVGPDLSDHCPYNDTCRLYITCLLSHDVGVIDLTNEEGHEWGNSWTDPYPVGTEFTCVATVENFGYNEEHDVIVDLEVMDATKDPDSLVWHNSQEITFLDWRGNDLDNPYVAEVTFPVWETPSTDWFRLECRTELVGDDCPDNDEETRHINIAVAETPVGLPFALEAIKPNPFVGSTKVSFALPHTTNVSLKVYDISGKLVATLVNGTEKPGRHSVTWNGTDDAGRTVAQGIYLVRMESESFSATKKVVLY
ncbi:T9SS type A sorting domain-containing protein [candidate division WOR-3 bacterium]|nr:T9SS type A sorting domain-containing protein [candidate division WOR-3 bacterium]